MWEGGSNYVKSMQTSLDSCLDRWLNMRLEIWREQSKVAPGVLVLCCEETLQARGVPLRRRWSTFTGYTTRRRPTGRAMTWARSTAAPSSTRMTSRSASPRCALRICRPPARRSMRCLCASRHAVCSMVSPGSACWSLHFRLRPFLLSSTSGHGALLSTRFSKESESVLLCELHSLLQEAAAPAALDNEQQHRGLFCGVLTSPALPEVYAGRLICRRRRRSCRRRDSQSRSRQRLCRRQSGGARRTITRSIWSRTRAVTATTGSGGEAAHRIPHLGLPLRVPDNACALWRGMSRR